MSTAVHVPTRTDRRRLASAQFSSEIVITGVWRAGCLEDRRETVMRNAFLICGFIAMVALPVDAGEQLKIAVSPAHSFAPAFLRVRVRIEPSVENRSLEVIADSGGFYRSSEIQLEGDRAPLFIEVKLRSVPEGDYRVVGILRDGTGHERSLVYQDVRVFGNETNY